MIFNANKQITLEDQGVHEMPCEDCEKNLIGQTNGQNTNMKRRTS